MRPADTLTRREWDIIDCAFFGWDSNEIGFRLGIGGMTVRVKLNVIYDKTGMDNRWELFQWRMTHQRPDGLKDWPTGSSHTAA